MNGKPDTDLAAARHESPPRMTRRLRWVERLRLKAISVGVRSFFAFRRLGYRLRRRPSARLRYLDHVTIPCTDLKTAEEFYVGLLGAAVMMRIDRKLLERMGWSREQIEANRATHLSLTLQAGPRIDLFEYPEGTPRPGVVMHPHLAFMVAPGAYLDWKRRLESHGVITSEIRRPGPPGQASFYFNDPFGNHLEIITLGFVESEPLPGVPDRSQLDYRWSSNRPTSA